MKTGASKYFFITACKSFLLIWVTLVAFGSHAQPGNNSLRYTIDSLNNALNHTKEDSAKVEILRQLGQKYWDTARLDSSILSYQKALEIVQKNKFPIEREILVMAQLAYNTNVTGNYSMSMRYANQLLEMNEKAKLYWVNPHSFCIIARNYLGTGDYRKALDYFFLGKKAYELYESGHWAIQNIAETYLKMHNLDSALFYNQKAYYIADTGHNQQYMIDYAIRVFADIYAEQGNDELALRYYRQFITDFYKHNLNNREIGHVYLGIANLYHQKKEIDSSVFYAKKSLESSRVYSDLQHVFDASNFLCNIYEKEGNVPEAFKYYKISVNAKDSIVGLEKLRQLQDLSFNQQIREKEQQAAENKEAARARLIITIAAILIAIASFLIWNRIRQLRLRHTMIIEQKEAEKLKAIDKMKDRFFSNITHELRTPLSLILSPVELYLQQPGQLKDPRQLFQSIYKNADYLLSLINQLLDISKLDAGSMAISLSEGYFGNYIDDLVKEFAEAAESNGLHLDFESNVTGKYLFDSGHWKKIVSNLLSNAIKFTPAGGTIHIILYCTPGKEGRDEVQLRVKDTGIGINKDQLPFITDRFYQADNSLARKYEGAGIGLALTNELVKLMSGRLEIESEEGYGSIFTVIAMLESAKGKDGYPELTTSSKKSLYSNDLPVKTIESAQENMPVILVVEDNAELNLFIKGSLEPHYKVITASNGAEGFQITASQLPDVIISDVMMPVMDGFEFCSKIKTDPTTSHIAFLMLSAKANHESKMTGLGHGADEYLTKPFSVGELLSRIKNLLQRQKTLRDYNFRQLMSDNPLPSFAEGQNDFLQNIYQNIQKNLDEDHFTVEFLASQMAINEGMLNRSLIANIGLSANELVRQYHLKRAETKQQMLELEAKALRSQMNPHFIFNCLNSIKLLIQQNKNDKSITYLTTFSKLIRTLLNNADKKEISLHDEIDTCKLYLQLEAMRFDEKFSFSVDVDSEIDLKSIKVPALIIQPFIENAIWHGIVPADKEGIVHLNVMRQNKSIQVSIDDNGIGREVSQQNKSASGMYHQSKGMKLTQSRLELSNMLYQRQATLSIIDKKDEAGRPVGTKVIIELVEEQS